MDRRWFRALGLSLALCLTPIVGCGNEPPVTLKVALQNEDVVLENGLRVVVQREPAWKSAVVDVRYRVGSREDPEGRSGVAHFAEHLLFRGTRDLPGKAFDEELELVAGGHSNAFTDRDGTEYFEHVAPTDVPRALFLEAQRMAFPLHGVTEQVFATERNVVENERRLNHSGVAEQVRLALRRGLYPQGHPYRRTTIGEAQDLQRTTLAEANAFVARHYRPDNATLIVVGNVEVEPTLEAIAKAFAKIPRPAVGVPERPALAPLPPLEEDVRESLEDPEGDRALIVAWRAPEPATPDAFVMRFARDYLLSELHQTLVIEAKVAQAVDVDIDEGELGSMVAVHVDKLSAGEAEHALSMVDSAVAKLTHPMQVWPVGRFRSRQMLSLFREVMLPVSRAEYMQRSLARTGRPDTVQLDLLTTQAVTIEEVSRVMEEQLFDRHRVVVKVSPKGEKP
jgi:zinc protease